MNQVLLKCLTMPLTSLITIKKKEMYIINYVSLVTAA